MSRIRLEDAFAPVPEIVHARVENTLKEIEDMKTPVRGKPRAGLLIAAIVLLALMGIAYASSQLGLLDSLLSYTHNEPSEALMESIVPVNVSETLGGVKITVTDVAYDGDGFALGYTCENLEPGTLALVFYEGTEANGVPLVNWEWGFDWVPNVFQWPMTAEGMAPRPLKPINPITGYRVSTFPEDPGNNGKWTVNVSFVVKRAKSTPIVVDPDEYIAMSNNWAWDSETNSLTGSAVDDYAARLTRIREWGIQVAEGDERDPEMWEERGYTVLTSGGMYYKKGFTNGYGQDYYTEGDTLDSYALMGNARDENAPRSPLEAVGRVTLTFEFDAAAAMALVETYEPDLVFPLDTANVRINRVVLSPLATMVEMDIEPLGDDWSEEAVNKLDFAANYELTDGDGNPLEDQGWGMAAPYGEIVRTDVVPLDEARTRWVIRCTFRGPGLYERPEAIRIVMNDRTRKMLTTSPSGESVFTPEQEEAFQRRMEKFNETVIIPLP